MINRENTKIELGVACSICLEEIPESVAMNSEADEYAQYFCGIECYDKWRVLKDSQDKPTKVSKK